jgi:hypothetical protein
MAAIHVLLSHRNIQDMNGRHISAFTRVFNALCPAIPMNGAQAEMEAISAPRA